MGFTLSNILFVTLCVLMFYVLRGELRTILLFAASVYYLYRMDHGAAYALLACIVLSWALGLLIDVCKSRDMEKIAKVLAGIGTVLVILILIFFKFVPRFAETHPESLPGSDVLMKFIIPIGFSYTAFQMISYFVEIAKGRIRAEKNIIRYGLFLAFFPKIVSGPIERGSALLPQIKNLKEVKLLDPERFSRALSFLIFGYFMKLMIADRVAPLTETVFNDPASYTALTLMLGSLLYTIQIYCDFAGYSMIAIGVGLLFGVELVPNFNAPYLSSGIGDFWRRWHMSLSFWLRDFLYIPLGGNRKGQVRRCLNTMIVFFVCGLWHGSSMCFVIWGILHGVYSVIDILIRDAERKSGKKRALPLDILMRIGTFIAVSFAWIFFAASTLTAAAVYIKNMLTHFGAPGSLALELEALDVTPIERNIFLLSLLFIIIVDVLVYFLKKPLPDLLLKIPYPVRYLLWVAAALIILVYGVYGPKFEASQFMYMKF